jgi:DNA-binding NarL/FixJ family response regulator
VRATRLIYVENDPALRSIITGAFRKMHNIELLLSTGSSNEALASKDLTRADAALVDLALGPNQLNGVELGIAMRERNQNIGIVVYSQYSLRNMVRRVPPELQMGWSFIPKSAEMDTAELEKIIQETAKGMSHDLAGSDEIGPTPDVISEFTSRQRAVIALASAGLTAPEISMRLGFSNDAVRKDLSAVYRLLIPDSDGGDLRTKAVLAYLRIMREMSSEEGQW